MSENKDKIKNLCFENEQYAYATKELFIFRYHRLLIRVRWINWLSFVASVMFIVLLYLIIGTRFAAYKNIIVFINSIVTIVLFLCSSYSLFFKFDEQIIFFDKQIIANNKLYSSWMDLKDSFDEIDTLEKKYKKLLKKDRKIELEDRGYLFSKKEQKWMMRKRNNFYRQKCEVCGNVSKDPARFMWWKNCKSCGGKC